MSLLLRRFVKEATNSRFLLQRSFSTVKTNPIAPSGRRTTTEFDNLIYEAGNSSDFEAVRRLLNSRVVHACFNTTATFKFLTNNETLIARLCKLGRIDDALILIGDMVNGRFGLASCTFHPIINALTKKNKIEEAWRVVESMRSHSIPVDVTSYIGKDQRLNEENLGSLASKLIKRKRFKEAKLVFKEICVRGLRMGIALRDFYETNCDKIMIDDYKKTITIVTEKKI